MPAEPQSAQSSSNLAVTVDRIARLVDNHRRDLAFRAPETVPEHQARLLNTIWSVLQEAQRAD